MENNHIEISGITSQNELNNYNIQYPCKEICKSYHITLNENKPNIELILQVFLKPTINKWKLICTHGENKIFIDGILNVKILFIGDLYSKNIYSTEFKKPLSELLPVQNTSTDNFTPAIFIEEAFINHINKKSFSISTLMVLCTISNNNNKNKENVHNSLEKNLKIPMENINAHSKNYSKDQKENSINVNIEYDMNTGEEHFK